MRGMERRGVRSLPWDENRKVVAYGQQHSGYFAFVGSRMVLRLTCVIALRPSAKVTNSVREYVFYVFFRFQKNAFLTFFSTGM